jgi:hypothetical protein
VAAVVGAQVPHRELYRGVVVWIRTARVVPQGARAQRECAATDVVTVPVPELAIIDETLWNAPQAPRRDVPAAERRPGVRARRAGSIRPIF